MKLFIMIKVYLVSDKFNGVLKMVSYMNLYSLY